jgi:DNA-binding CsgD family transcriptional regulator
VTLKAVKFHLNNAYRKLDIEGRDELRAALVEDDRAGALQ